MRYAKELEFLAAQAAFVYFGSIQSPYIKESTIYDVISIYFRDPP